MDEITPPGLETSLDHQQHPMGFQAEFTLGTDGHGAPRDGFQDIANPFNGCALPEHLQQDYSSSEE